MRKSLEAVTTMVSASTGITYAAERRIGDAGVNHYAIDRYTAGVRLRKDCVTYVRYCVNIVYYISKGGGGVRCTLVNFGLVGAEDVETKGMLALGYQ